MTFKERIEHLVQAGFQAIYISTGERGRCESELELVGKKIKCPMITWDSVSGLSTDGNYKDPIDLLMSLDTRAGDGGTWGKTNCLLVLRNLHTYLEDPTVRQAFQNLYFSKCLCNEAYTRTVILLSPVQQIHTEIAQCVTVAEFSLPAEKELTEVFEDVTANMSVGSNGKSKAKTECDEDTKTRTVKAMRGLSSAEAENILAYGLRVNKGFGDNLIDTIEDQKAITIEKSEILTYIPKDRIPSMDNIGGFDDLKTFINIRKAAYTKKAVELNMDLPRGIVLLGIMGTAKSMVSKIISRELGLPLILMNVGAVFGSLVGESERRIRTALNTVDAMDGSVVVVDEADKALGGTSESIGDSGVSRRVFGTILTWLTEKKSRTFVVMTMNRTRGIPPEFLRKGR